MYLSLKIQGWVIFEVLCPSLVGFRGFSCKFQTLKFEGRTSAPTVSHGPRTRTFLNFVKLAWCHWKPSFVIESKYINSRWCHIWKWWCTTRLHAHWWVLGGFFSLSKLKKYLGQVLLIYSIYRSWIGILWCQKCIQISKSLNLYSKATSHCPSPPSNGTEVCLKY